MPVEKELKEYCSNFMYSDKFYTTEQLDEIYECVRRSIGYQVYIAKIGFKRGLIEAMPKCVRLFIDKFSKI